VEQQGSALDLVEEGAARLEHEVERRENAVEEGLVLRGGEEFREEGVVRDVQETHAHEGLDGLGG